MGLVKTMILIYWLGYLMQHPFGFRLSTGPNTSLFPNNAPDNSPDRRFCIFSRHAQNSYLSKTSYWFSSNIGG